VEVDDDGNGYANITLKDGSAASPTMGLNDVWSHKFDKPGTYTYQVTVYSHTLSGLVVRRVRGLEGLWAILFSS